MNFAHHRGPPVGSSPTLLRHFTPGRLRVPRIDDCENTSQLLLVMLDTQHRVTPSACISLAGSQGFDCGAWGVDAYTGLEFEKRALLSNAPSRESTTDARKGRTPAQSAERLSHLYRKVPSSRPVRGARARGPHPPTIPRHAQLLTLPPYRAGQPRDDPMMTLPTSAQTSSTTKGKDQ